MLGHLKIFEKNIHIYFRNNFSCNRLLLYLIHVDYSLRIGADMKSNKDYSKGQMTLTDRVAIEIIIQ